LDTSTEFLFGEAMGTLNDSTPWKGQEFLDAFHYAMKGTGIRFQLRGLRFLYRDRKWNESLKTVHAFVDSYVEKALAHPDSQPTPQESDLDEKAEGAKRERYILLDKMAKQTKDRVELRYQALHVFMAGHDSSSITVANALFYLCRHPAVYQKLRTEMLSAGDEALTFESLKSLRYLQHIVKESKHPQLNFLILSP
jgi:cytochrome P450